MLELPLLVRAGHHMQRAVYEVGVHNVSEDADRTLKSVLKVGRVLVQMLGMAPHRLLDKRLTLAE